MSRLDAMVEQMGIARGYTLPLIDSVAPDDWFRRPSEGITHVGWEVGHLAAAEYYLTAVRIRGRRDADKDLISDRFLTVFGRGSDPDPDPGKYPAPEEIRGVLDGVHAAFLAEYPQFSDALLDEPVDPPHPMFSTKFGALSFCPLHEMVHAGQIGLLRRLLGQEPLR